MPIAAPQTDRQDLQIIELSNARGDLMGGIHQIQLALSELSKLCCRLLKMRLHSSSWIRNLKQ
jgi:hypothetical protein